MSGFNVGDRIRSRLTARDYTVIAIGNDNTVYISDFYPDGPWRADRFEPATPATPPIGETVAALRKAAGLPAFMVGDVVRCHDGSGINLTTGSEYTVTSINGDMVRVCGAQMGNLEDRFTLLTPAPCVPAANDNDPPTRKFKVGDWVRDEFDDIGKVIEDDGDPEDELPYLVEFIGLHYEDNFDADKLEPWTPREGDYVRTSTGETGRVDGVSARFATLDGCLGVFRITDLEPCLPPKPAAPQWKVGDTVVVIDDTLFHDDVKDGAIGVVEGVSDHELTLRFEGLTYFEQCCDPYFAADYLKPWTPETAAA